MESLLLNEDETMLRDSTRGFLDANAPVKAFRKVRDEGTGFDKGLWREMAQMGWAGVLVGEDHGGVDMGHRAAGIIAEEMGQTLVASPFISTAVIAATALRNAANARAGESLSAIAEGNLIYALAIDEGAKFAPERTGLEAAKNGNAFKLSGKKGFVAEGRNADRVLVLARTGGAAGEAEGLTLFDIDAARAGLSRDKIDTVDGRDFAAMTFDGVDATSDDVVGEVGGGMEAVRGALRAGQAALAAELTGLSSGSFAMTATYLKERKQFDKLIGTFQALQHRAAHMWSEIEVTASAIANAGRVLDANFDEAELAVSLAKARATETAKLCVIEGVQMHGGIGMTDEFDMGFFMKRARVGTEWLGDYGYHAARVAAARGF